MMVRRKGLPDRPRIVDVARAAGVSHQTVSNVLNNRPGCTDETRERVLKIIAEIGYVRDATGRALRTGESQRFAFSIRHEDLDPRNPYAISFLRELVAVAAAADRRIVVLNHESETDGTLAMDLATRDVDGYFLVNSEPGDYRVRLLEEHQVPYALMGRTLPEQSQSWIDIDNEGAIGLAVDHVIDRGFRKLAYVGPASDRSWLQDRRDGATKQAATRGYPIPDHFVILDSIGPIESRIREVLLLPDRPDAIITASDAMGMVAINIAHSLGIEVGHDIAVTGFDGSVLADMSFPTLTTVSIPTVSIVENLLRRLMEWLDGNPAHVGEFVTAELVIGGSA